MMIIKIQQCRVKWYAFKHVSSGHDINPSFVWKFDHEILRRFGAMRIQNQASAYNKFYIIWSDCQIVIWYTMNASHGI